MTYNDIKPANVVVVQGHAFEVLKVWHQRPKYLCERPVVRFIGKASGSSAKALQGTVYDGGTYGAYADLPCGILF